MITAEAEYTRAFLTIVLTSKTVLAALDVLSSLRLIDNEHGLRYNFAQLDAMLAWQIRRDRVRIVSVIC